MKLKKYNDFMIKLLLVKPGYALVVKRDINLKKDVDFSKTAKSWFGRNIISYRNQSWYGHNFDKGDILWVQYDENNIFKIGSNRIVDSKEGKNTKWYLDNELTNYWKGSELHETVTILESQGDLEIIKFEDLPENDALIYFYKNIKYDIIKKNKTFYNGERVVNIDWYNSGIKVTTLDKNNREQKPLHIDEDDFLDAEFLHNGKVISESPFEKYKDKD